MKRAAGWLIALAILGGAGYGGWFVGVEYVASQPDESLPAASIDAGEGAENERVVGRWRVPSTELDHPSESLVLGATGLSPFGQPDMLLGRHLLAGRVSSIGASNDGNVIELETATGPARVTIRDDSTFMLGIEPSSQSAIQPGAAVAVVLDSSGRAAAVLALPAEFRPVLNPGVGPAPGQGGGQGQGEAEEGGGG